MSDKDEATRLADHIRIDQDWCENAAALLRRWPDGEPEQKPVLVVERHPDYWSNGHFYEGRESYIDPTKVWDLPIGTKLYTAPPAESERIAAPPRLWLWRNWVDGRPEYLAFDNPYPLFMDSDDPQTLGEPCGYAIVKPSRRGRPDVSDEDAAKRIKSDAERIAALNKQLQRYIGASARYQIEIGIIEDIFKGEDDFTPSDMEYWGPLHDKAREQVQRIAELEAALTERDERISAADAVGVRREQRIMLLESVIEQARVALEWARTVIGRPDDALTADLLGDALRAIEEAR